MKKFGVSITTFFFISCFYTINAQEVADSVNITNVGDVINSKYQEYAPVISADGNLLMFTTKRPVNNKKRKKLFEQVWYSVKNDKTQKWSRAKPLSAAINQPKRNTSNIAVSNDGQKLLLYVDDLSGTGDIYESTLKGKNWSTPTKLPYPINTKYHESSASYSPDGNTIYFVSNRPNGKGGRDIWMCKKKNGKWGSAKNLGAKINSKEDEEAVFIHPDGKTLYFSSKKKGGYGGYDIYKATLKNNKWSTPKNMEKPINTKEDDLFFVVEANGKIAYYASDRKGTLGGKDIFKITFIPKSKKQAEPKLTLLKGIVSDAKMGTLLGARIELIDNDKNEVIANFTSNSSTGKYLISLPSGKDYGITVRANGYLFQSENINLPDSAAYQEVIKNIALKKIEIGSKIVLNNIFFDYNKATIKITSIAELKRLASLLLDNKTLKIEISGHTDNIGSSSYNQKLSTARAKAVVDYLVHLGINAKRLLFKGYGFEQPIASNDTEEGRAKNRRTEFKIINK